MTPDRVNWLNVGLMLAACAAALVSPFRLFLLAYAILGPLHYLTEISWLHDRDYFAPRPALRRGWLMLVGAAMIAVMIGYVSSEILGRPVSPTFEMSLVVLAFVAAGAAVFSTYRLSAVAVTVVAAIGVAMVARTPQFAIAAYLLITMIHVLVFTGCFILFGAAKSRSTSGLLSFFVFCACAVATLVVAPASPISDAVRASYAPFAQLNQVLLMLAGSPSVPLDGETGRRVMQLIAFAYIYHYLNWFSKTTIIRWHEVTKRRALGIVGVWIASVALYAFDYRAGFSVLYVLSILHVLVEFPLNHATLAGLVRMLRVPSTRRLAPAR